MQFNYWMNYWVNLWVNWLLQPSSTSNQASIDLFLKPGYISTLDPNLEESGVRFIGRCARVCTEVVFYSTLPRYTTAMRRGLTLEPCTRGVFAGAPGGESLLLGENRKKETWLSQASKTPRGMSFRIGNTEKRMQRTWVPEGNAESLSGLPVT